MTTETTILDEARKLPLVNETVSAFIAGYCAEDPSLLKAMQDDPRSALAKAVSVDLSGDYEVRTVQNTEGEVNIAIPTYKFDSEAIKRVLSEAEMQRIAGGFEIIFVGTAAILATIGVSVGTAATVGSAVAVGAGTVAAGAAGAAVLAGGAGAVVGGAVAGGVVASKKKKKK